MALQVPTTGNGDEERARRDLADWLERGTRQRLQVLNLSRLQATQIDPDRAAKVVSLALREKLPQELVDANLEEVEANAKLRHGPPEEWWRRHPIVARYVRSNPYYAALTEPEIQNLGRFVDELLTMPRWAWPIPEKEIDRLASRFAEREAPKVAKAYQAMLPPTGFGPQGELLPTPVDIEKIKADLKAQEAERLRAENSFVAGKDPLGLTEQIFGVAAPTVGERIPFIGDLVRAGKAVDLYRSALAVEEGRATEEDLELLRRFWRLENAAARRGTTFMGELSEIGASLIKTIPEFALTGGVYGAGKEGAKRLLLRASEKAAEGAVRKAAVGAATRAAGLVAQTTAIGAARTVAGTIERMTPRIGFTPELEAVIAEPGDDFLPALLKSYAIETVQVGTERLGRLLGDIAAPLKRFVASRWLLKYGTGEEVQNALARTLRAAGWHGVVPEILEERAAGFGEKLIEGKPLIDALAAETPKFLGGDLPARRVVAEAIAFAIPGAASALAERAARRLEERRLNEEILRTLGEEAAKLAISKKAPEALEELARAATDQTDRAFLYAKVDEWEGYWKGAGSDPAAKAEELGVERQAYERAKATGGSIALRTGSYVAKIGPTEHNAPLAAIVKGHPEEMTEAEAKEFLQVEEERIREREKALEALMSADAVRERAKILARQMASEELRVLRETDIIAQIERATPGRIYWSDPSGKRNVEELAKANVPKHMIASPETAREKGHEYAVAIDEVADLFGMKSDELVHAIEEAWARRKAKEAETREPEVSEQLLRLVSEEILREDAAKTVQPAPAVEEKKPAEPKKEAPAETSSQRVRRLVAEQLSAAGFRKEDADAQAQLVEAVFRTLGVRLGRDPYELYERYGLRVMRQFGPLEEVAGQVLEQPSEKGKEPKGRTRVRPGKIEIDLFRKADLSTFLHEMGHFFLEVVGDLATSQEASEDLKADWQTILSFLGVSKREEIGKPEHEKWAKAFEAYLFEGKAPSVSLKAIFAKFKAWLLQVYRTLTGIGAKLSGDIRRVFDRLVAPKEELDEAYALLGQKPLDVNALGMSREEARYYAELVEASRREAEEKLHRQVAKEMASLWKEEYAKVRQEVERELHADPRYIAAHVMRFGRLPDGREVPGDKKDWKLSKDAIIRDFGGEKRLAGLRGLYTSKEGAHPDELAELLKLSFGLPFRNGEELLTAIENLEPLKAAIERLARARTEERVGPAPGSPQMAERVQEAIHNEKRGELLLLELRHIAARSGRKVAPLEVFRHWAESEVEERLKIGELIHGAIADWRRAAARANKAAFEAVASKDWDRAFVEKERELLNLELLKAAEEARKEIDRAVEYVRSLDRKAKRDAIARAGGDYLEQIDALLERFEFKRLSPGALARKLAFRAWVEEQEAAGAPIEVPEELLNDAYRKSWLEMSVEELLGVVDTLKHLEHLARFRGKLLRQREKAELDARAQEAADSLIGAQGGKPPRKVLEPRSPEEERKRSFAAFLAAHVRIPTYAREFDQLKDGGVWFDTLLRPANEAATSEQRMVYEAIQKFEELKATYYKPGEWKRFQREKTYFQGIDAALSKEAVLSIALNWGNEDNRVKLMRGRKWTEAQVKEILESLEERDWRFVQDLWDWLDTFWPEIERVSKNLKGIAPKKVKAAPVVTRFGTFKGGYYPLRYEPHESERVSALEAKQEAQEMFRAAALTAQTRHGHRKERVRGVNLPVRLDLGVLFEHVRQVIHDVTHAETIYDLNRFIRHETIERAIKGYYGTPVYTEFKNWVRDIARGPQPAYNSQERALLFLRTGAIVSRLGWNLKSALLQFTGLSTSVRRIGFGYVMRAAQKVMGTPSEIQKVIEGVRAQSEMMRFRTQTQIREVTELREKAFREGKLSKIQDSWLFLTSRTQYLVDTITWLAAYEKAMERLGREEKDMPLEEREAQAVAIADQTVLDTQGSGEVKDLASVQRATPLLKLFTTFYGYFGVLFNETRLAFKEFAQTERGPRDVGKLATDLLLLYSFPAAVSAFITQLAKGDDDDDTFLEKVAKEHAATVLNTVVLVREITGVIESFQYRGPAGSAVIGDVANFMVQVGQGEVDEAALRAAVYASGGLFHYPAVQLWRVVQGIKQVLEGEAKGLLTPVIGR